MPNSIAVKSYRTYVEIGFKKMWSNRTKIALGENYFEIKIRRRFFSALGPETDEQMKLAKNKIRVNL